MGISVPVVWGHKASSCSTWCTAGLLIPCTQQWELLQASSWGMRAEHCRLSLAVAHSHPRFLLLFLLAFHTDNVRLTVMRTECLHYKARKVYCFLFAIKLNFSTGRSGCIWVVNEFSMAAVSTTPAPPSSCLLPMAVADSIPCSSVAAGTVSSH